MGVRALSRLIFANPVKANWGRTNWPKSTGGAPVPGWNDCRRRLRAAAYTSVLANGWPLSDRIR